MQIMVYSDALNLLFIFRKVLSICNINNCPKWLKTICLKGKFQEYVDFEVSQRLGRLVLPHQLAYTFCSLGHVHFKTANWSLIKRSCWQNTARFCWQNTVRFSLAYFVLQWLNKLFMGAVVYRIFHSINWNYFYSPCIREDGWHIS